MVSKRKTNWLILLYVALLTCSAFGLPQGNYNQQQGQQQPQYPQQQNPPQNQNHIHHQQQHQFNSNQNANQFQNHDGHNYNQLNVHSDSTNSISQFAVPPPPSLPQQQPQLQSGQFSEKLQQQQQNLQAQAQKFQQQAYLQNQQTKYFQQQQQQQQQGFQLSRTLQVPITSYNNELSHDGSFAYGYTTGDGQHAQAQGFVKNLGNKDLEAQVVQGAYSYTSPDGTPISVKYLADENGFRAEGLHLPTPPPIPDAIARALQYIARVQATNPQLYLQNQQQQPQQLQQQAAQNQFTGNFNKIG